MNFTFVFFGSIAAALISFLIGSMLYMNPLIAKIYKKYQKHPSMSKYANQKKFMLEMFFFGMFIPSFIAGTAYSYLKPGLYIINGNYISITFVLGLMLAGIRIVPRFFDMNLLTSYPKKLLFIELINGIILSFVMAIVLTFMI